MQPQVKSSEGSKMSIREKLYVILEQPENSRVGYYVNLSIYILILLSILNLMLMTVEEYNDKYGEYFLLIRNIVMPIFVIEYVLRFYAAGTIDRYKGFRGKVKYATSPYPLIDLLSIVPYVLSSMIGYDNSSVLRVLRLLRILRIFRVKKYANFAKTIKRIFFNIKEEIVVLMLYTIILLVVLSFVIFNIEHRAQPEIFSNVFQTMWWSVATLTTVGYGDMYPVTPEGRFITAMISLLGIAFVAIPGSLFASEFISEMENRKKRLDIDTKCPICNSTDIVSSDQMNLILQSDDQKNSEILRFKKCGFSWFITKEQQ